MKFAAFFLACLASAACHQQRYYWGPQQQYYDDPDVSYYLRSFDYGNRFAPINSRLFSSLSDFYGGDESGHDDAQARVVANQHQAAQRKFIIPSNLNFFNSLAFTTASTTIFTTISSTAVVASIQPCIPANLFNAPAAPACARRRRAAEFIDLLAESSADDVVIAPSKVIAVRATAEPESVSNNELQVAAETPELDSSKALTDSEQPNILLPYRRNQRLLAVLVSVTTTVTSFSFRTTTINRTFLPVAAPAVGAQGPITCLPPGFVVC